VLDNNICEDGEKETQEYSLCSMMYSDFFLQRTSWTCGH